MKKILFIGIVLFSLLLMGCTSKSGTMSQEDQIIFLQASKPLNLNVSHCYELSKEKFQQNCYSYVMDLAIKLDAFWICYDPPFKNNPEECLTNFN